MSEPQTTEIRTLPCKLTAQEKLLKSDALTQELFDLECLEEAKKNAVSAYAEQIKSKRSKMMGVAREVRTGEEFRPIECTFRFRYDDMMVDVVRIDTGAVVETRGMHPSERQQALDLEKSKTEQAPKARAPKKTKRKTAEPVSESAH